MAPTPLELSVFLNPLVPESLAHNTRTISNIRSISGLLLGIAAGILGLESLQGFAFYLGANLFLSALFYFVLAHADPQRYFAGTPGSRGLNESGAAKGRNHGSGAWREIWLGGGLFADALSGFVLGWAGVGGVIR
ncbi:hypothetical protein B0A52_04721 [Exophiala mesophila]|uniref:ER membrane protein complex subunit 6 n=1 Tax=Exophiala mesophila TaxID=212818 RepID=A0A438N8M2_EXOME|nr:hypothetical protein B0A52_04721 [Exophiala mesophila]